ncbi:Bifunctional dTDP-4-dehydrorhamnose 3,5-epimerase/dTDP-4-dehydrorhamnose reductase [Linum perenne]
MLVSSDLSNPHNFIAKISKYEKMVNIPTSLTVLGELLPISIETTKRNLRGVWNFKNPGVVTHNELLELYQRYIDPNFKCTNFTIEEQTKIMNGARSNNELDSSKLKSEFPEILSVKESLIKYVFKPNKKAY